MGDATNWSVRAAAAAGGTPAIADRGLSFDTIASAIGRARHAQLMNQQPQGPTGGLTPSNLFISPVSRGAYAGRTRTHNGVESPMIGFAAHPTPRCSGGLAAPAILHE